MENIMYFLEALVALLSVIIMTGTVIGFYWKTQIQIRDLKADVNLKFTSIEHKLGLVQNKLGIEEK